MCDWSYVQVVMVQKIFVLKKANKIHYQEEYQELFYQRFVNYDLEIEELMIEENLYVINPKTITAILIESLI